MKFKLKNFDEDKYKIFWMEDSVDGIPEIKEKLIPQTEYLNQENTAEQEKLSIYKEENGITYYKSRFSVMVLAEKKLIELKKSLNKKLKDVSKALRKQMKDIHKTNNVLGGGYIYSPYIPVISSSSTFSISSAPIFSGKVVNPNFSSVINVVGSGTGGKSMYQMRQIKSRFKALPTS